MTDTHPLRIAADVVDANITAGKITETLLDALKKRTSLVLTPTETLSTFNFATGSPPYSVIYGQTGYVYFYNPDDTTTADDGSTCLVSADGRRYIRRYVGDGDCLGAGDRQRPAGLSDRRRRLRGRRGADRGMGRARQGHRALHAARLGVCFPQGGMRVAQPGDRREHPVQRGRAPGSRWRPASRRRASRRRKCCSRWGSASRRSRTRRPARPWRATGSITSSAHRPQAHGRARQRHRDLSTDLDLGVPRRLCGRDDLQQGVVGAAHLVEHCRRPGRRRRPSRRSARDA
jgi:hypothetical protein